MKKSSSRSGIRPSSKQKVSDMLSQETKKMEEKLELVKKMMTMEKDKRSQVPAAPGGTLWRSATTKKQISGYSDAVMKHHKQSTGGTLPPTSQVTETRVKSKQASRILSGRKQELSSKNANDFIGQPNLKVTASKITSNITTAMR